MLCNFVTSSLKYKDNFQSNAIILFVMAITINNCCSNFIEESVTLTIDQGTLVGKKLLDYWNETFYSFEGIPFAKPPIGELRFKAPEPAEKWSEIYDATKIRPICPQIKYPSIENMEQNEDCLFLSVYSKMSSELKPVMVWFFGGGLKSGNIFGPDSGPELLISQDIVLVKVSYRLNIFGFLKIDDPKHEIYGNAGLKDQVLALKWIQQNIHHFGGDSNQVTLFGHSAGGCSVNLLSLSPLAEGLFHRAIIQSGNAESIWMTSSRKATKKYSDTAKILNDTTCNLDDTFKCINESTTENLLNGLEKIDSQLVYNEKHHVNSFLEEKPREIISRGNLKPIPTIIGLCTDEISVDIAKSHFFPPNFTDNRLLIPPNIKIDLASDDAFELGNKIKELYYGDQTPSFELIETFIEYLVDAYGRAFEYKYAKILSNSTSVYFYDFNYHTKLNSPQNTTKKYILHGDELPYLFYTNGTTPKNMDTNSEEYIAIHRMIKLWTTFAKTGNPNPKNDPLLDVEWLPVVSNNFNVFKISQKLELLQNPYEKRMKFWEKVYEDYDLY